MVFRFSVEQKKRQKKKKGKKERKKTEKKKQGTRWRLGKFKYHNKTTNQ